MNIGGEVKLMQPEESETQTRSDSGKSNVVTLLMVIVGVLTPYAFVTYLAGWVFLTPLFWFYWPLLELDPGANVLYLLTLYGLPGVLEFVLFLYTIIGRLCYPYQMRRYFQGKSGFSTTLILGLVIELPIILSLALVMPVYPLPISTLIAIILMKYFDRTQTEAS